VQREGLRGMDVGREGLRGMDVGREGLRGTVGSPVIKI